MDAQRPIILNGIEELATRPDLLDRAMLLDIPVIPDDQRQTEAAVWQQFEKVRPKVLGGLLTGVSAALKHHETVSLDQLPRLADFATWVTAAEPALGWQRHAFLDTYVGNRDNANDLALESSIIVGPLRQFVENTSLRGRVRRRNCWPGWKGYVPIRLRSNGHGRAMDMACRTGFVELLRICAKSVLAFAGIVIATESALGTS